MPELIKKTESESVWKKIARLFRSGPVVRHKIAAGEKLNEPRGTGSAYKRELSNLYVHMLSSYGQYERLSRYADYCLSGETLISVPDKCGARSIKEITERFESGETQYVFSCDPDTRKTVCSPVTKAWCTGKREIWEVELDSGQIVRCTDNHPFMLRDGSYCRTDELTQNMALMPFNRVSVNGYRYIKDSRFIPEHVIVANMYIGREVIKSVEHVHHINFDRNDNFPTNLKVMLAEEHLSLHAKINNQRFSDPLARESMSKVTKNRWSENGDLRKKSDAGTLLSDEGRQSMRKYRVEFNKKFKPGKFNKGRTDQVGLKNANADRSFVFQDVCNSFVPGMELSELIDKTKQTRFKILKRIKMGGFSGWEDFSKNYSNHKVVSIRRTGVFEDVYDLTVDGFHNFAICENEKLDSSAIFVHNSEMEFTPEIASALDIYADETSSENDQAQVIKIESSDHEIKQILETLFFEVIDIEFNIWSWIRGMCKYGDYILFVDANEENGILNLMPIPINEIEREEGYDKNDPFAFRFRWQTQGNMVLEPWQVIHFRLLGNDAFLPYGQSVIEPARRIWRQLILIEDAMLVYRIVRSPERRVFKIDVGNIPADQVEPYMEQVKTKLRRNQIVDPSTGRVDLRYNPLSVDEDYFIPVRSDKSSDIQTLAGGQFTGDIEDVQYIQNKLFAALKIPKAYLGYEAELGSKATLSQQDIRFARTIGRVQRIVVAELNKIAIIHLFLLGKRGSDLVNFNIKMANPSLIAEQQKLELWRMRLEVAGTAQEGALDREFIWKNLFGLSDKEIDSIRQGKRVDRIEDLMLEQINLPENEVQSSSDTDSGSGEKLPGEDELPKTLGGPPGGGSEPSKDEPAPSGEPSVAPEGVQVKDMSSLLEDLDEDQEETISEDPKGTVSGIAVDKGHDLFKPDVDQKELVFGTKYQTASDPFDNASMKRIITKPFSEEIDTYLERSIKNTQKLDENLKNNIRRSRQKS